MPARVIIKLENIKNNINKIKGVIKNKNSNAELLVMVKADAYGAGAEKIAGYLEAIGVNHFGVAYLKEAKILRNAGIKSDIIVFSGILPEEVEEAVKTDVSYAISNIDVAKKLSEYAVLNNKKVRVHIAIDTGMTRLGLIIHNQLTENINILAKLKGLQIEGVFSHFSSAGEDEEYTRNQLQKFNKAIDIIEKAGIELKYKHIFNSAAILKEDIIVGNIVRAGICAYGYYPFDNEENEIGLKGCFKLEAPICDIRDIEENTYVSYSRTFKTKRKTKIATIQIGYADGLSRCLSNEYRVNINGAKCNIIGNICMDMCMVDVTDAFDVKVGDYVNIFDYESDSLNKIAKKCNTINYEILTQIGKRVERKYE